jgi:hypothetical protein
MRFDHSFYAIDHRLIVLAMLAVLVAASEIGYRAGARTGDAPDSLRSLMSGIGAATLGILGVLLGFTLSMRSHVGMAVVTWSSRKQTQSVRGSRH